MKRFLKWIERCLIKEKFIEKPGTGIAPIPGALGTQMMVEACLKRGEYSGALQSIAGLPDGEQKTAYLRLVIAEKRKSDVYGMIMPVSLLPDEAEKCRLLEEIIAISWVKNQGDWMLSVMGKYPLGERRTFLLEEAVKRYLKDVNWRQARKAAEMRGRLLTTEELEAFIADNLVGNFHHAKSAAGFFGRNLKLDELRQTIEANRSTKHFLSVYQAAVCLPNGSERLGYLEEALQDAIKRDDWRNTECIRQIIGRPLTNEELRRAFVISNGEGCNYTELLAKDSANFQFLEDAAVRHADKGDFRVAINILSNLPVTPIRNKILAMVGLLAAGKNFGLAMKAAKSLEAGTLKTYLAGTLLKKFRDKFKHSMVSESAVRIMLENIKFLPKGELKLTLLKNLFEACWQLNLKEGAQKHPLFREIEEALNQF